MILSISRSSDIIPTHVIYVMQWTYEEHIVEVLYHVTVEAYIYNFYKQILLRYKQI